MNANIVTKYRITIDNMVNAPTLKTNYVCRSASFWFSMCAYYVKAYVKAFWSTGSYANSAA